MTIHKEITYRIWDAPDGGLVCCREKGCFERFTNRSIHKCWVWANCHARNVHSAKANIHVKQVGRLPEDADV